MKSRYITPSLLMASLITLAAPSAMASDELAGALFGAGSGAVLGHIVGGGDGALVGGVFGAIVGAAIADNDDHRHVVARPQPYGAYGPTVVRYAPPPRPVPYYARHEWRHDWHDFHDGPRYRNEHRWREERRDQKRRDWNDGQNFRDSGPRDYRNW